MTQREKKRIAHKQRRRGRRLARDIVAAFKGGLGRNETAAKFATTADFVEDALRDALRRERH